MSGLDANVVDVPLLLANQLPPRHAGPIGRLTAMLDAQVKQFLPSTQQQPQRILVEPRESFHSLSTELRDSATGAVASGVWSDPELLSTLGEQLLSICDSRPRVYNGTTWTYYGGSRVPTNRLSEDVLHTTNHPLQASDDARIGNVTCSVWTETSQNGSVVLNTTMVGFRGDDKAWVRTPTQLFQNNSGNALARVVSDGTQFWVIFNTGNKIAINVFDTHGVLTAFDSSTIPLKWTPTPGYWDVGSFISGGIPYVLIAQPNGFSSIGSTVGVNLLKCTVAGATITIASSVPTMTADCSGPIAFVDSTATGFPSLSTIDVGSPWVTEFSHALAETHAYQFGISLGGSQIPDSLTGWMEANGSGAIAHIAYSLLSNFSPPAGPPNDPGLRYTRSYACTRAGAVTLTNQVNGVLLQSRAFPIDDDWYAATYYQSGGGNVTTPTPISIVTDDTQDYFTGDVHQPVVVQANDFATGGADVPLGAGYVVPTQSIASITHNAADNVAAGTKTWHFVNASFAGTGTGPFDGTSTNISAAGALLHISGATNAQNDGDWWVTSVVSGTDVVTEQISLQGNSMVTETFGAGVAASLTQVWPCLIPQNPAFGFANTSYPTPGTISRFLSGVATISGAAGVNFVLNGTYSIYQIYFDSIWRGYKPPFFSIDPQTNIILLTKTSGPAGSPGSVYFLDPAIPGLTISPLAPNAWALVGLGADSDVRAGIDVNLVVSGAKQVTNNNTFLETDMTSAPYGRIIDVTGSQPAQRAEVFLGFGSDLPTVERQLVDPSKAFTWHFINASFDASYLNALLTMSGANHLEDNGLYQITQVLDSHTVVATPADGRTGQTLYNMTSGETVTVSKSANAGSPEYQPCWYLTPLSTSQKVAGRWEYGIAYADWRFDGNAKANSGTFERNAYPLALSSVVAGPDGLQLILPYRAQSFTAGQTVTGAGGNVVGVQTTAESTVGLKLFSISSESGQAVAGSSELLLPGLQASEFTASGFTEDGINLGPEKPFIVSQTTDTGVVVALSPLAKYQYLVCFEVTDESGDRVWSVVSPPLDVTLTGTQNTVTIGGRMPGPTLRVVGVSIYRTAMVGNPQEPTVQHYKITNDLLVNGPGFTFSIVNGGADFDTWQFKDQIPDALILSSEVLYTDGSELQHFPAPAFSHGIAFWRNRYWVVGYDGAVWMSAEKTEGDAVWFTPAFRYPFPTDDPPVAVAAIDSYLIVFCGNLNWYIPAAQFPAANGQGSLPTPQPLPFPNGCTGHALTMNAGTPGAGAVYSSTAGGVWMIDRSLRNVYLSQPEADLQFGISSMTVDGKQRLLVATDSTDLFVYDQLPQAWYHWRLPTAGKLLTTRDGNAVYQDSSFVSVYTPGDYTDMVPSATGIAPDVTLSLSEFGNVRGLKCVWACNIVGEYRGPHNLNAVMSYPDEDEPDTTFGPFPADPDEPYIHEINPMVEETTSYGVRVFVDFAGVPIPGNSMALELLSFEVGIQPNLAQVRDGQRIQANK